MEIEEQCCLRKIQIWIRKTYSWWHFTSRIQYSALSSMLPIKKDAVSLDLGCGKGYISIELAQRARTVISLDISTETLSTLKIMAQNNHDIQTIYPLIALGSNLPFHDFSIDIIICNSVLEHINEDRKVIEEISRVLIDNGILGLTVPNQTRRFAYWLSFFWKLVLRLPPTIKQAILQPYLINSKSIHEVRCILEKRFDHKHLYTYKSLCEITSPFFKILKYKYYMKIIGAICHDMLYAFKGLQSFLPSFLMRHVSFIDNIFPNCMEGKGIAIFAIKIIRKPNK